ncbi:MAG TPA: hypothetical protein VGE12_08080 [Noviherbaspirillum sp.]
MDHPTENPHLTMRGVVFTISTGATDRQCLVSKEGLSALGKLKMIDTSDADLMDVFRAFELTISDVAHRVAAEKAPGLPIELTPSVFSRHATASQAKRH